MSGQRIVLVAVCAVAVGLGGKLPSALAIPPFWKEFEAKYVKADSADDKDKAFAKLATDAKSGKCNVCHVADQEKKVAQRLWQSGEHAVEEG